VRRSLRLPRALALACLLAGCAVGPDYHRPTFEVPDRFLQVQPPAPRADEGKADESKATEGKAPPGPPAGKGGAAAPSQAVDVSTWWQALHDPELDSLVERALKSNPSLDIALARLLQARTFEILVTGLALPRIEAAAGGGTGTGTDATRGNRAPTGLHDADHVPAGQKIDFTAGFDAAWELDLFGRLRRQIEAAHYDAQAAASARDAVQVTVISDVARAYLDLRGLQMQLAVQLQSVRAAQDLLNVVQARFDRGIINELDVTLARRQLASAQSQVAPLQAQISATQQVIAVLLGMFPQQLDAELSAPGLIPPMPERIGPGLPLDLIRRRPDVREAEWQLAGATARIGVATGLLFPQIVLTAGLGEQGVGSGISPASTQRIWSAGYGAVLPLLDFGVLDAQVKIADLQTREQLSRYKQTIQAAVQDVDSALAFYAAQQNRLLSLGEAVIASQRATELATERYDRGLTDFLNVIDAQRQEYDLEGQYAAAQTSVAEQFVNVYRGLGGGWEQFQEPPTPRPRPAVMAMFQHLITSGYRPQP
jgi:NodT family efflux transporter outer membrane factor (OMF) lipoprotein